MDKNRLEFMHKFFLDNPKSYGYEKASQYIYETDRKAFNKACRLFNLDPAEYHFNNFMLVKTPDILRKTTLNFKVVLKDGETQEVFYETANLTLLFFAPDSIKVYTARADYNYDFIYPISSTDVLYTDVVSLDTEYKLDDITNPRRETFNLVLKFSNGSSYAFPLRDRLFTGEHAEFEPTEIEYGLIHQIKGLIR